MTANTQSSRVQGRVIYVLVLVILVQTIYPITADFSVRSQLLYQALYTLLILAGIVVTWGRPRYTLALSALACAWLVTGTVYAFNATATWALISGYSVLIVYSGAIIQALLVYIFEARAVSRDVLYAAVTVYMMLGAVFVPLYGMVDTLTVSATGTHAFVDNSLGRGDVFPWQTLIYYSYVTLTTAGYGDVLPVTMWARSIASLEAIIGVMYVTIIMARLVSLYAADRIEEEQ